MYSILFNMVIKVSNRVKPTDIPDLKDAKDKLNWLEKNMPVIIGNGKALLITLLFALLVYLVGRKLIKFGEKILEGSFSRSRMEKSVSHFLLSVISVVLNIVLLFYCARIIGIIGKNSGVAVLGSAGLAIGLALQGSLSNFAGGIVILAMKPFKIGDYIVAGVNEGTVITIDVFYTKLKTVDNRIIVIPNGTLSNTSMTNVTNEPTRRLDLDVSIDYSEDMRRVMALLANIGESHELVLEDPGVEVFVMAFNPSAIKIGMRLWTNKEDYWKLKCDMLEKIKTAFDENNIIIPFDLLDVNLSQIKSNK